MSLHGQQTSVPQRFSEALDAQLSREDRQGFVMDLIEAEVLPRQLVERREVMLHIGANRCHLACRLGDFFQATHVVEPNSYQLPPEEEIENVAVHTEDVMSVNFGFKFDFILVDHLLHSLAISSARAEPAAYLGRIVELLREGGVALIGTLAPRGPLHDLLSSLNPAYVGSAAVQAMLAGMEGLEYWVVEHSNVASLPSKRQLILLLELHAFLVQLVAEGEGEGEGTIAACDGCGDSEGTTGQAGAAVAPTPAGPLEEGNGQAHALMQQFVADAFDGAGRYNWVEEDDYILLQKLPLPVVEAV